MQMKRYNKMAIVCKSEETEHLQCHIDHKNTGNDRNDPPQSAGQAQGFSDSSAQSSCHRIGNDPARVIKKVLFLSVVMKKFSKKANRFMEKRN